MGFLGKMFGSCRNDAPRNSGAKVGQTPFNRVVNLKKPVATDTIKQTLRHIDLYPTHFYNKISKSAQEEVLKWAYEVLFYVDEFYNINDKNVLLVPDMSGISKHDIINSIKIAYLIFIMNSDERIKSLYDYLVALIDAEYPEKEKDDILLNGIYTRNRRETGSYILTSKNQKIMDEVISRKIKWFYDWQEKVVDDAKRRKQSGQQEE